MRLILLAAVAMSLVSPAQALPPETSLRPVARASVGLVATLSTQSAARIRPQMRPSDIVAVLRSFDIPQAITSDDLAANTSGVAVSAASMGHTRSLRPMMRPKAVIEKAMAKRRAQTKGKVCGDRKLQGEIIGYVPGKISGCGIENAVLLKSVSGIPLSQPAMIDCPTAKALKTWVNKGMSPAVGTRGGGVKEIKVVAHYACRTRNNQVGAKISEHGRGRAIDIAGFRLKDGSEITVLKDWGSRAYGRVLKKMHKAACGTFGTVLGPESDRFHKDHFHFDTARYRSGSYCR